MMFRKISAFLIIFALFSFVSLAWSATYNYPSFDLTVPDSFDIRQSGWNNAGEIRASSSRNITLSIDAILSYPQLSSDRGLAIPFSLVSNDGQPLTNWQFTKDELKADRGTGKPMGVSLDLGGTRPGTYTAKLTFSALAQELAQELIDLSKLPAGTNYVAKSGDVFTGKMTSGTRITIPHGVTITLSSVDISSSSDYACITCSGDARIILADGTSNNLVGSSTPGIYVVSDDSHPNSTLTITGNGSLNVQGGDSCAGIGCANKVDCGNIEIKSGNITATGGDCGTGIGSSNLSTCGTITISGGTVNATGGGAAAGIGGGNSGKFGNITISGGIVNATGGDPASAGIGCGNFSKCSGDITISGGTVSAYGSINGAGIGSSNGGECGNITISGGIVSADGGRNGAGIGSSNETCGNITISGGTVSAKGGDSAAGIGNGGGTCGNITIYDGTVSADGGPNAAGIGSGSVGTCGYITISGGTVSAGGGSNAAGIGSGFRGTCGNITINDGVTSVTATKGTKTNNSYTDFDSIGKGSSSSSGSSVSTVGTVIIGGKAGAISTSPYTYKP